ncbi:MAG: hypothetical protein P1U35_14000 [Cycloclasticus sp.]|nr:hypothetical protein [Cycloclasticus sp.]
MQYDNTNSGAIFPAREKKSEKHPDMTGSLNVGGVEYYVSAWTKVSKQGQKFLSLSVNPKQQVAQQAVQKAQQTVEPGFDDDDLPF